MKRIVTLVCSIAMALLLLLLSSEARANGNGLIQTDSIDKKQDTAIYTIISTKDGGYATVGFNNDNKKVCVCKYDANDSLQFATLVEGQTEGAGYIYSGYNIAEAQDGGFVLNTSLSGGEGYRNTIIKLDAQGHRLWGYELGDINFVNELVAIQDGGVMVAAGNMLYKLSTDGQMLWQRKPFDVPADDKHSAQVTAMCLMNDGRVLAVGEHFYHPDQFSQLAEHCVAIYDTDGNIAWMEKTSGTRLPGDSSNIEYITKQIYYATTTSDGGFILSGFDEGFTYLEKRNSNGEVAWRYKNANSSIVRSINGIVETDEGYFAVGHENNGNVNNMSYNNTAMIRFSKNGSVIDKTTIFEGIDQTAGVISRGKDAFLIAGRKMQTTNVYSGVLIKVSINRDSAYKPMSGWKKDGNAWYYYNKGHMQRGWVKAGEKWYLLDYNGRMMTGWVISNSMWYHLKQDGSMTTGWLKDKGKWYYLHPDGTMATEPTWIDNTLYCFKADGALFTGGWMQPFEHTWYYAYPSGRMAVGWTLLDGKWQLFNKDYGQWTGYIYGKGWVKNADGWSFIGMNDLDILKGWQLINNNWYYLGNGIMQTGWQKINGKWYHLKSTGEMTRGWLKVERDGNTLWYYMKSSGAMVTGEYSINGVTHVFSSNGVWLRRK